jgi:hypothetical protein
MNRDDTPREDHFVHLRGATWEESDIGCLVEVWCLERGIEFSTYGSWTLQIKAYRAALQDA